MKSRLFFTALLFAAALACTVSCEKTLEFSSLVNGITVDRTPENVLRIPVDLEFSRPCSYYISYWEKAFPADRRNTRTFESDGSSGRAVIMFIKSETDYCFQVVAVYGGKEYLSEVQEFRTAALPEGVPTYEIISDYPSQPIPGYIFQCQASSPTGYLTFCTTDGEVVWYEAFDQAARHFYFDQASRTIVLLTGFKTSVVDRYFQRWCDKYVHLDLEGNRLEEWKTSAEHVEFPHHEIKMMPNGNVVFLHGVAKEFDLSSIGGDANQLCYGDGFTIYAPDGSVVFDWDIFGELDPVRDSYLNAALRPHDLVHANSVAWDGDGNYYFTLNHLNELWKIDGRTGKVLWRVGDYGNIDIPENGYTEGIHSAEPLAPNRILVLDNGSVRGTSRALVYRVDESSKSASIELDVSIPARLSSADRSNCLYFEDKDLVFFGSTLGRCWVFTDTGGNILKAVKRTGISYRTYYFEDITY